MIDGGGLPLPAGLHCRVQSGVRGESLPARHSLPTLRLRLDLLDSDRTDRVQGQHFGHPGSMVAARSKPLAPHAGGPDCDYPSTSGWPGLGTQRDPRVVGQRNLCSFQKASRKEYSWQRYRPGGSVVTNAFLSASLGNARERANQLAGEAGLRSRISYVGRPSLGVSTAPLREAERWPQNMKLLSGFCGAALMCALTIPATMQAQDNQRDQQKNTTSNRTYHDAKQNDDHQWNDHEDKAYQMWTQETRRKSEDFAKLNSRSVRRNGESWRISQERLREWAKAMWPPHGIRPGRQRQLI